MTDTQSSEGLLAELQSYEGRQIGTPEPGPEPVNRAMIRHWVEAMGDENPVYMDEEAAAGSAHGGLIAPPTMLQAWIMRGLKGTRGGDSRKLQDDLLGRLDAAGFTSVVATNCEQEYLREIRPGDHLTVTSTIESVSAEKRTGLGVGHFVTTRQTYTDQHGEVVAYMLFRILKFRPPAKAPSNGGGASERQAAAPASDAPNATATTSSGTSAPARPRRPRPSITQDNAFFFEGAKAGKLLIQRCSGCGTLRHPPGAMCPACRSLEWDTVEASGRGVVYSYVVNHYPQVPAFDYPLAVALVELEEGTRLVSNVVGVPPEAVEIGMPVQVEFAALDEDLTLPQFRPVKGD